MYYFDWHKLNGQRLQQHQWQTNCMLEYTIVNSWCPPWLKGPLLKHKIFHAPFTYHLIRELLPPAPKNPISLLSYSPPPSAHPPTNNHMSSPVTTTILLLVKLRSIAEQIILRQKSESQNGWYKKTNHAKFSEKHFLPPDTYTYICVSGGKK